jgi:FkbM family methyltransferase
MRKTPLKRFLTRLIYGVTYEKNFSNGFLSAIRPNDVVWDIGANVGFYSNLIASKLNSDGVVIAIEPLYINFALLESQVFGDNKIKCFNFGIAAQNETLTMKIGDGPTHATSAVTFSAKNEPSGFESDIIMYSADYLVKNQILPAPNAIKIDVEGFELNVFHGMKEILASKYLSLIAVEVHFELLEKFGFNNGPKQIENLLKANGYKVTWTDLSHLIAQRSRFS